MAKYSKSPVGYFMDMPMGDFCEWIRVMNEEIERENDEWKRAVKKK